MVEAGAGCAHAGLAYRSAPGRWVLAATVLGSGIAGLDATVVNIALPTVGRDFHVALGPLQWVVSAYTLTLTAFLLLGGALGDRFGRRRVFLVGVVWFALASAACGLAPSAPFLIATRALQGVGSALLTPGSLAILQASFAPDDRARAIGAWSGLGGLLMAAGPLVGGWLLAVASWRWVFFINVPIAAVVVAIGLGKVPESRGDDVEGPLDPSGALLAAVALAGVTYGLIEGPTSGWSSLRIVVALVVAVLAALGFVWREATADAPMLPLQIFAIRQFSATNLVTFVVYAALGGALFLLPTALQVVDGYSPLSSGLALLHVTALLLVFSPSSGRLAARVGPRLQMTLGPLVAGAGLALLARVADSASYPSAVLPGVFVFGLGMSITVAPLTATAMSSAPAGRAGLASAVNNDVARGGSLLAVAVLPALAGITGSSYLHPRALAGGFREAVYIAALACGLGGLVALVGIRNSASTPAGERTEGRP